jgi:DNA-directed RNA polymerase subunit A'
MREEDMKAVGLDITHSRPEWFLVSVLPVPPLHVRPSVSVGGGAASEDDLTHQLVNVITCNLSLQQAAMNGEAAVVVEQFELALQPHSNTPFWATLSRRPRFITILMSRTRSFQRTASSSRSLTTLLPRQTTIFVD